MVDTGASVVALRERDADKLGIFPAPRTTPAAPALPTASLKVAPVRLPSLEVNGIRVYDVQAAVIPDQALEREPARHVVSVARAPLRDGEWPSRDGTVGACHSRESGLSSNHDWRAALYARRLLLRFATLRT